MKRRDFVKHTALTAIGASLISPMEALAGERVTHLESDDLSPSILADDNFPLNFVALGDWGRSGEYHQLEVGKQMGVWAATHPNKFIISVGDNFYPRGVVSEHDPLWHYSFENVYTAHSLQDDWYPVLGNHDYGSDPDAQVRYSKVSRRWNMPSRYYSKEMKIGKGKETVLFVFIDTQPIVYDMEDQAPKQQLAWIDETLKNASSDVKWKIVVGHHPCYTVGPRIKNYDTLEIRKSLTGLFEKHKVDIYLSGHEHSLQHLKINGFPHQFISGAGSELTPVESGVAYSRFESSTHGFMYFSINTTKVAVKAINDEGTVLYQTTLNK
ncbi:tartrate-resistant acid phosphatase type 5 family protein [Pedobacter sp. MC2016-14]|uniref:purple acid phosphatase family protein n=1 Tax=Pedobacter sp. MC2016-14 TaxID=2897327 RepID=UPI001E2EB81A|nr:tartrate-resistant acid phosphatase type 5 family protein [Pedobacter sp. MC2016-14]MCD0487937.1 tartrate-resistant acid phosphatase type 5 family protein [Pedobacter sp. MC2016-14]